MTDIQDKSALELEKLRHEVETIRKPFWHDPKLIGTALAFMVSLAFNVMQAINAQAEARRKDAELMLTPKGQVSFLAGGRPFRGRTHATAGRP